jgi:16S rRNA (uracil1498-N3)-methyltransferase
VSRRRWIADEWDGRQAAITGQNARHLAQVLRAKVGQSFELAHAGELRLGKVANVTPERVTFALGEQVAAVAPARHVTIALAIFKFDRFEWAVEKLTELGVNRILPFSGQRSEAHLVRAAEKRAERWRRIAHEAAQQSRRASEPVIDDPWTRKRLLDEVSGPRLLLTENERSVQLSEVTFGDEVTLAIGPEGGWTATEEQEFRAGGWEPASLGTTILRAETAAIAATVLAQSLR